MVNTLNLMKYLSLSLLLCSSISLRKKCPCTRTTRNDRRKYFICSQDFNLLALNLSRTESDRSAIEIISSQYSENARVCDAILHVHRQQSKLDNYSCPGICHPIPYLEIYISRDARVIKYHHPCSYDESVLAGWRSQDRESTEQSAINILEFLFFRRLAECQEEYKWENKVHEAALYRRKVQGLIIWVGSKSREHIGELQRAVLSRVPLEGESAVIGWHVTEDIFPCSKGTTTCQEADHQGHFLPLMPLTLLGDSRCEPGWACAQRRPLRALSHALSLFDPQFLFIADDDTYLNYPYMIQSLGHRILGEMSRSPIVLGNFIAPRYGQLSPKGFFLGGAGYLLGKEALRRLVNKEVFEWAQPRPSSHRNQRAWSHAHTLSVAREARLTSQAGNCSSSCFLSNVSSAQTYVPLTVRLVDLCRDLMAGEHTCHHSDHSMSRCLFYGMQSHPKGLPCGFQASPSELALGIPLMCGHTVLHCNLSTHVTCHRWRPTSFNDVTPVPIQNNSVTANESVNSWRGCLPAP